MSSKSQELISQWHNIRPHKNNPQPQRHENTKIRIIRYQLHHISYADLAVSTPRPTTLFNFHLILSSHLCAHWFISVFPIKTLYAFLISPIQVHAKCLTHVFIQTSAKCDAGLWLHRKLTSSVLVFSEKLVLWMEGYIICRAFYIWVNTALRSERTLCSTFLCSYLHPTIPSFTSRYSPQHAVLWPAKLTYYHLLSHESSALFLMFQKHLIVVAYCSGKHPHQHHMLDSLNSCKSW